MATLQSFIIYTTQKQLLAACPKYTIPFYKSTSEISVKFIVISKYKNVTMPVQNHVFPYFPEYQTYFLSRKALYKILLHLTV
jgi:hypothetical protein